MDTIKLIKTATLYTFTLILCGVYTGCNEYEPTVVSQEKYNELLQEYNTLKASSIKTIENNENTKIALNQIFEELNEITGNTSELKIDIERGSATDSRTTVKRISRSIEDIKKRLNAIPTKELDKQTIRTIKNLQKTIQLNEQEIKRLNVIIAEKDVLILELDKELSSTSIQLESALNIINDTDRELWMSMGDELVKAADLLPNVKGHGNMKPIKQAKLIILTRAIDAYEKAQSLGHTNAKQKVLHTERLYRNVKNK